MTRDGILVMKFGGTSVGSPAAMRQAVEIVRQARQEWSKVVVVTSALAGVTNQLLACAQAAQAGDLSGLHETTQGLRQRHAGIAGDLIPAGDLRQRVLAEIEARINLLEHLCRAVAILGEATPRALDAIAALGERCSTPLLAGALRGAGVQAQAIDAERLIAADATYLSALPDIALTRQRCQQELLPLLERGLTPVVTGFIAGAPDGSTVTLGRGGSDYSAALVAAAIDAEDVWIWTDVDGVMSADPRQAPAARTIPELTFREIGELAFYGAKVLHPKTIRPVIEAKIGLRVCNTFNPAHPGTRIVADPEGAEKEPRHAHDVIKAVTAFGGLRLMTVEGRGMLGVPGVAARTFETVAASGVSVPLITQASSEQSICFALPAQSAPMVRSALESTFEREIARRDIDRVSIGEAAGIVTVVGAGMRHTPGVAGRIFVALGEAGVNVIAIAQGSSEVSVSMVIDEEHLTQAVQALHALTVGRQPGGR